MSARGPRSLEVELPGWVTSWPCDACGKSSAHVFALDGRTLCGPCLQSGVPSDAGLEARLARPSRSGKTMRPFQAVGARWLSSKRIGLLQDSMGTGKTITALRAVPSTHGLTVIAPKTLLLNWRAEALEWRPELVFMDQKPKTGWVQFGPGFMGAISYEQLRTLDSLGNSNAPSVLVTDEAHRAKDPGNATTQAVREAVDMVLRNGGLVWELTGTPMLNHKEELWAVWQNAYLGHVAFDSWGQFDDYFGGAHAYQVSKRERRVLEEFRPEFRARLDVIRLRRTKREVLPELPPKKIEVVYCEISPEDAAVIHEQAKRLVAYQHAWQAARDGTIPDPNARSDQYGKKLSRDAKHARLEGLRQHAEVLFKELKEPTAKEIQDAVDAALAWQSQSPGFELLAKIRAALAVAKIKPLLELVQRYEEAEEPLVVFSAHRKPVEVCASRGGWEAIEGTVTPEKRQETIKRFQAGSLKGVALTIKAGGVGITLTHSCNVVFADLDWTPANNAQAEDRLARLGQTRECTVTRLVADHVVDRRVQEVLAEKIALIESVDGEV